MRTRRLLIAGDVHSDAGWFAELVETARDQDCDLIVQLGDLGFFPRSPAGREFLEQAERVLARASLRLFFLEGDHDDLDALWRTKRRIVDGLVEIDRHISYLRRGQRFSWRDVRFLAVGGAHSIDRSWRIRAEQQPRTLWWPEEMLSDADVARASEGSPVDILLAHDCPLGVEIPSLDASFETYQNRQRLARIIDATRPRLLLHGHYHLRIESLYWNRSIEVRVPTIGLAREHSGPDGWAVLDLDEFSHGRGAVTGAR